MLHEFFFKRTECISVGCVPPTLYYNGGGAGLCPGGLCPGDLCLGGLCPGGLCPVGLCPVESLSQ